MRGTGPNQGPLRMSGQNARVGGTDVGAARAADNQARRMAEQNHFTPGSNQAAADAVIGNVAPTYRDQIAAARANGGAPGWMGNYDGAPVAYSAPTAAKEQFQMEQAVYASANKAILASTPAGQAPAVQRVAPITEGEVGYLKSMRDMAELAKFDEYVETLIDPRQPGNMKWLMEVYPDYVSRRLQQAHSQYEFALRNQMIDSWGINTFDDLHFKYLVDQGQLAGPSLKNRRAKLSDVYAPGWFSPYNFYYKNNGSVLGAPYSSAETGRKTIKADGSPLYLDRTDRPFSEGTSIGELADGMYMAPNKGEPARDFGPGQNLNNNTFRAQGTGGFTSPLVQAPAV